MTLRVTDYKDIDSFQELLDKAEAEANNEWEQNFVADLMAKYVKYGDRMYLSESQKEHLEKIAND